jgi:hypothetical protein
LPPTFGADKLPSLRNKTAWEVRCFGSVTSVQDEDCKEINLATTEELAEPRDEGSGIQTNEASVSSEESARKEDDCSRNESKPELVDDIDFIECLETQIELLANASPACESSYVIDLELITDYVPVHEPDESYDESYYFINGGSTEACDDQEGCTISGPSAGASQLVDGPVPGANPEENSTFEFGTHSEHLSMAGLDGPHEDIGSTEGLLSDSAERDPESYQLTVADVPESLGSQLAQSDIKSCTGAKTSAAVPSSTDYGIADNSVQVMHTALNLEVVESGHVATVDFERSLDGDAWAIDEAYYGEVYNGIESQFDYLTIEDPNVMNGEVELELPSSGTELPHHEDSHLSSGYYRNVEQGELEVKVPSFSDSEFEYADMPSADFVDSLVGLEVFRSGNILVDEPGESFDADACSNEFKIDGPLEELFNRVFQSCGVSQLPFILLLLRLDEVSRAALFRHHVSWLGNVNGLPKDRALWLLALSAVVDVPLDSQTSAAFRALLRHCSGVRALKESRDDEDLFLLNVLITVAGVYFGQAEAT